MELVAKEKNINRLTEASLSEVRAEIRNGRYQGQTSGLARGYLQGNVVILPSSHADDFLRFCTRNPQPCPLVGISEPGNPMLAELGADVDIRTDVPQYRIWRDGKIETEVSDIRDYWNDDMMAFVIGCSFSFEEALIEAGLEVRHISCGLNVPMFETNIETAAVGPFYGPLVVSMRPMKAKDAIRAIQITSRFPRVHGAPVHIGDPSIIGINDISKPDYGDPVTIKDNEIPVFWACGVTPQAAIKAANVPFCITHSPGCMLITDRRNTEFAVI